MCMWICGLNAVDFVIFSYDRPLQLYALLESAHVYIKGINQTYVIYRVSGDQYMKGYQQVIEAFPDVIFHKQGNNPEKDFKALTLHASFKSSSAYIMFGVDDIIVKDYVDLNECVDTLEKTQAYAFYLRLGMNLTCSYPASQIQKLPPFKQINNNVVSWHFNQGEMNWGYPNTVDMTIYRKNDIRSDLAQMNYMGPNSLESDWSGRVTRVMHREGICFCNSAIVNVPLNRVQTFCATPHMNLHSAPQLLELFLQGKKMDIKPLFRIQNGGCHMDYEPTFIKR